MAHETLSLYKFKTAERNFKKFWNYIYYVNQFLNLKYQILLSCSFRDILFFKFDIFKI